jgi:hypothetical protein
MAGVKQRGICRKENRGMAAAGRKASILGGGQPYLDEGINSPPLAPYRENVAAAALAPRAPQRREIFYHLGTWKENCENGA